LQFAVDTVSGFTMTSAVRHPDEKRAISRQHGDDHDLDADQIDVTMRPRHAPF
jgi:hypothetical protein